MFKTVDALRLGQQAHRFKGFRDSHTTLKIDLHLHQFLKVEWHVIIVLALLKYITGWWFQPIWKILVKLGIFPK